MNSSALSEYFKKHLPNYYYKEDNHEFPHSLIDRLIYEEQLKDRDLSNTISIYEKDERCKEEIIKMIESGKLIKSTGTHIAKLLDSLCLFNHKITPNYVTKLLNDIDKVYISKIEENKENWEKRITKIMIKNYELGFAKIAEKLNTKSILTITNKKWTTSTAKRFFYDNNLNDLIEND